MDDWKLEPARDQHLEPMERYRSSQREGGLFESIMRLGWWIFLRTAFRIWNRLQVRGREYLPANPSFVIVANHASHLDAPLLTSILPLSLRDQTFPIAARDVFFERLSLAAFSAVFVNAFPVARGASGRHFLSDVRDRLLSQPSVVILFPEGTRTRTGEMNAFKSGIGMLVAGTEIPVVSCFIDGARRAMPPEAWLARPRKLSIRIAPPVDFRDLKNDRDGWDQCAKKLEEVVRSLA